MVGFITIAHKQDIIAIYGIEVWIACETSDTTETFLSILVKLGKI